MRARSSDGAARALTLVLPVVIVLVTLAAFLPALRNGFVDLDDRQLIVDNVRFRGLGWPELRWMFTTTLGGPYLPLTWLSLGLDYVLWGLDPVGFHLTNLILHGANALVFYALAVRLLRLTTVGTRAGDARLHASAALAALLFAVHPLRVESVAWATGRKDVLSGLFYLLAVLCYVRAATAPAERAPSWRRRSVGAFVLSLLAKGMGITLPLALVVLDVYPLRRLPADPRRWRSAAARAVVRDKLPYLVAAAAATIVGVVGQARAGAIASVAERGLAARVATALYGLAFYAWRTLVPVGLAPMHHLPMPFSPLAPPFVAGALAVVAITVGVVRARRRCPALLAVWVVYALTLAPVLGLVQLGLQLVAERYSYLACLGWPLLAGGGGLWALRGDARPHGVAAAVLAGGIVLVLAAATWRQSEVWHDPETLWRHALAVDGRNYIAHHYLAGRLAAGGRDDEALAHYEEALRLAPGYGDAQRKAAELYAKRGELAAAVAHYRAALLLIPAPADVHYNLGLLLYQQGQVDEATAHYQAAVGIDPDHADAHDNLGAVLYMQGRAQEAVAHFQAALRVDPARAGTHNNLGAAWAQLGQLPAAAAEFREALRLDPGRRDARASLDTITPYLQTGR